MEKVWWVVVIVVLAIAAVSMGIYNYMTSGVLFSGEDSNGEKLSFFERFRDNLRDLFGAQSLPQEDDGGFDPEIEGVCKIGERCQSNFDCVTGDSVCPDCKCKTISTSSYGTRIKRCVGRNFCRQTNECGGVIGPRPGFDIWPDDGCPCPPGTFECKVGLKRTCCPEASQEGDDDPIPDTHDPNGGNDGDRGDEEEQCSGYKCTKVGALGNFNPYCSPRDECACGPGKIFCPGEKSNACCDESRSDCGQVGGFAICTQQNPGCPPGETPCGSYFCCRDNERCATELALPICSAERCPEGQELCDGRDFNLCCPVGKCWVSGGHPSCLP
jgi:hypothetical protein